MKRYRAIRVADPVRAFEKLTGFVSIGIYAYLLEKNEHLTIEEIQLFDDCFLSYQLAERLGELVVAGLVRATIPVPACAKEGSND